MAQPQQQQPWKFPGFFPPVPPQVLELLQGLGGALTPAPPSPESTPIPNLLRSLAGGGNVLLDAGTTPQSLGAAGGAAVREAVPEMFKFLTTPEGEYQAGKKATEPPAAPRSTFKAGLPKAPAKQAPAPEVAEGPMEPFRQAISSIESGGNYASVGPTHPKQGRALGRYQIMETNIPSWSKEALGKEVTAEEFLASPEIQDAIFDHKFGSYIQQTGSPQDAASMWFTGRPQAQGANAEDVLGTSGSEYVNKFNKALGAAPMPPARQAAVIPGAPQLAAPPARPMPVGPDFSGALSFLAGARPQAPDANAQRELLMMQALGGLFSGAASVDVTNPGGLGRMFGAMGAGAMGGATQGLEANKQDLEQYQQALQEFALRQAGFAERQAGVEADVENAGLEAQWGTGVDRTEVTNKNKVNQYEVTRANSLAEQEAATGTRSDQYEYDVGEFNRQAAGREVKVHSATNGKLVYTQGGKVHVENLDGPTQSLEQLATMAKLGGEDSLAADAVKYQLGAQMGNVNLMKNLIVRDLVRDGVAGQIFSDFPEIMEAAEDQAVGVPGTEEFALEVNNIVASKLLADLLKSDDEWVKAAAAFGNPGAAMLLQGGTE